MSDDNRTVISPRPGLATGTRLNGIYEIESLLAVGGMGEVYKGRAIETGDAVAIKMIRHDMAQNEAALALFRKEAAALHNLYNEAIVRYYVFTIDPVTRQPYLAMEFVDGQPLSERIKQNPLSLDEADLLRRRIATGLHAAHQLGITHRDVSPDNIILPGGSVARAKIIDFGIARSTQLGEGTVIGSGFAGKYNYVSPEQLGLYGGDVGGKSDIYSLGLVLAEALAGQPLDMGGTQMQILDKRRKLPDIGLIDARIRPLIAAMLAPDPAQRPVDMAAVAAWQPAAAMAATGRRRPIAAIAAALVAVLAVAGGGILLAPRLLSPDADSPAQRAASPAPSLSGPAVEAPAAPAPQPQASAAPLPAAPTLAEPPAPAASPAQPSAQAVRPTPPQPAPAPQIAARTEPTPPPAPVAPTLSEPAARPVAPPPALSPPVPQPPAAQAPVSVPVPAPALPPPASVASAQPPRPATISPSERIERYVASYDGGPCFFLWPTAIAAQKAEIEGFGTAADPFVTFDSAFQKENGFEAQIQLRPVTAAQCPVTTFLRQLDKRIDRRPRLQIGAFVMKSGEALSGSVEGFDGQNLDILLIGDDGLVYNLASYLRRDGAKATFALKLQSTGGAAKPQIVLALVSPSPLATTSGANPMPATEFFAALAEEAKRSGDTLGLGLKYFRLE